MTELLPGNIEDNTLFSQIKNVLDQARRQVARSVNSTIVQAYWQVGKYIVEYEQQGQGRAEYGKGVIKNLSARLMKEYGSGFTSTNLKIMRQFYLYYPKGYSVSSQLTWTHWRALLRVQNEVAREYYIKECAAANWSVRQLERQINTMFYERMLASRDKDAVRAEIEQTAPKTLRPREIIHDPCILEFLGIRQGEHFLEGDFEQMLISKLQQFLLELGRGYSFVARQKRISLGDKHFYIDLVFYNYILKCFFLIDLKTSQITHQDVGQMDMYVRMYDKTQRTEGDNPTIGLVLCSETSEDMARYSVLNGNEQLFQAKYLTYLPTKEQLIREIEQQKLIFELQKKED